MQTNMSIISNHENRNLAVLLETNHLESLKSLCSLLLREIDLLSAIKIESDYPGDERDKISLEAEVERFEINLIKSALFRSGGNQFNAARILGVKYTTLHSKIKRYKIEAAEYF